MSMAPARARASVRPTLPRARSIVRLGDATHGRRGGAGSEAEQEGQDRPETRAQTAAHKTRPARPPGAQQETVRATPAVQPNHHGAAAAASINRHARDFLSVGASQRRRSRRPR